MKNHIGQTKYYNNRPVTILKDEGNGFYFVVAELNLSHDQTGSNWCTMCQAGGDFIVSHECDVAQEVIDHLMENIEDREVFWISERYLNDAPFEFKPYQKLVDEIENLKSEKERIDKSIKESKEELEDYSLKIGVKKLEYSDLLMKIQNSQHDLMITESEDNHSEIKTPETLSNGLLTISTSDFVGLVKSQITLSKLESGGVDNWEWYSESLGDSDLDSEAFEQSMKYYTNK